jgi:predicted PhzF superfamily epimerase YddE/YHI9
MQNSHHASVQTRPFRQVDVFTATPYFGNPLAVVLDGSAG